MHQLALSRRRPLETPFFYGWVIVAVSALGVFFSGPGQTYSVSTFIDSYIAEFGWSRSLVSSLYSGGTLAAGLIVSGVGALVDRLGHKRMFPVIASLLGVVCLGMSFVSGPAMLFVGFLFIRLFGQGSMTLLPNTLVPQWFVEKRGRALSIMSLGGVIASAVLPPLNTWIIHSFGWRMAWRAWALLLWAIMVPIAMWLVQNKPEDMNLRPDGAAASSSGADQGTALEEESWSLPEALKTRTFWLILFCSAIPSMINTGLIFHQVSIFAEKGLSSTLSASVLSVMALTALPVTFLAGWVLDRVKVNHAIGAVFIGQLVVMLFLLRADTATEAITYGVIRGFVQGFEAISFAVVWPNYFGRRYLGSIRGSAMTVLVAASAAGPLPFGMAFDFFGGYTEIIVAMMLFPVLGVAAALLAPAPTKSPAASAA